MSDMLQLLPENIQERFDSRHRLVLVAAQRAKHLMQGAKSLAQARFAKETTQALDEVLQGQIQYLRGKEARDAIKESRKGRDLENERMAIHVRAQDGTDVTCVQIAGLVARRILCYVREGERVTQGQRYGFIRFGSRVDLYLPLSATPKVSLGERTVAGLSVVASLA